MDEQTGVDVVMCNEKRISNRTEQKAETRDGSDETQTVRWVTKPHAEEETLCDSIYTKW